jgi:hypothetical protein
MFCFSFALHLRLVALQETTRVSSSKKKETSGVLGLKGCLIGSHSLPHAKYFRHGTVFYEGGNGHHRPVASHAVAW